MPLRRSSAGSLDYEAIHRGHGVLVSAAVITTGIDFTLTDWQGAYIRVTAAAACLASWFDAAGQSITSTDSNVAQAVPAGAQLTNGFPLSPDIGADMLVPMLVSGAGVFLRVAYVTCTTTVRIERSNA